MAILLTMATTLAIGQGAVAQPVSPEESLKVTHETLTTAVVQGNLAFLRALIDPRALGFFYDSQMIVQLGGSFGPAEAMTPVLADLSRFTATATDTTYRAVGDTGIACMTANKAINKGEKPKKGEPTVSYMRLTYVYIRVGDAWKLLSWHSSETPLKR
jgi:hypothetical protein